MQAYTHANSRPVSLFLNSWIMVLPNPALQKPQRKYWKAIKNPIFNYCLDSWCLYEKNVCRKIYWSFTIRKLVFHQFITCKKVFCSDIANKLVLSSRFNLSISIYTSNWCHIIFLSRLYLNCVIVKIGLVQFSIGKAERILD